MADKQTELVISAELAEKLNRVLLWNIGDMRNCRHCGEGFIPNDTPAKELLSIWQEIFNKSDINQIDKHKEETSKMSRITDKEIVGCFDLATKGDQEIVKEIVANFHCRTGERHDDGSRGVIKITPGQLKDCLAYCLKLRPDE